MSLLLRFLTLVIDGARALCVAIPLVALPAFAQSQTAVEIDLPAQALETSLRQIAELHKLQLVYVRAELNGKTAPPIKGKLTVSEALAKVTQGTGLSAKFSRADTVTVKPENSAGANPQNPTQLAQVQTQSPGASDVSAHKGEQLVVVGSRLGGTQYETAQPVKVINREEIERSGATSVPQLLNLLPEVSFSSTGSTTQGQAGITTVRLRGLPSGTTLVLLNGRRITPSASQAPSGFFNLSNVPLAAVERIEVLPTGSSAVYGGDALAGIVNIVLKKDFQGGDVTLNYGYADAYDEKHASLAWGHDWGRTSFSIVGTYDKNSELKGQDRTLSSSMDYRPYGGIDQRLQIGNPGNVFSRTSANLPGLNSTFAAVPRGSTGVGLTPASFAATAGTLNYASILAESSIFAPEDRAGAIAYGTYRFGASAELFAELFASQSKVQHFTNHPLLQRVTVPANNPFNPFGSAVLASFWLTYADMISAFARTEYYRPLMGARGETGDWKWEVAAWMSRDHQKNTTFNVPNTAAVNAALASTDPTTALNVFQDGPGGSPQLLRGLLTDQETEYRGQSRSVSGTLRGSPLRLPGGSLEALIGAELERNDLEYLKSQATAAVDAARQAYAVFGEVRMPLIGGGRKLHAGEVLALSSAIRYDHYSDFGSRTTPSVGIELRPMDSLLLRGAYSTSFKPPLLQQLYSPQSVTPATVVDARLGDITYTVNARNGGNPNLQPQTGKSHTIGIVYSPREIANLTMSLTRWALRLDNGAITPSTQYLTENESAYPDRVIRDSSGRISLLIRTLFNFGFIDEAGYDFNAQWRANTPMGAFTPNLAVTRVTRFDLQDAAGVPPRSALAVATAFGLGWAPRWKGVAGLGWERGPLQASILGRYVGKYRDGGPLANGTFKTLGDIWHFDANVRYQWSRNLRMSIGVVNLLEKEPVFSNTRAGWAYDPSQYDIRGRFVYIQASRGF